MNNIWGADVSDMQLLSKFSKAICILLVNILGLFPLKEKRGVTITNGFQKNFDESGCKPNKILVDKGSEFYNRSMKSWLERMNGIEIY